MPKLTGFAAYPSRPAAIGETIRAAIEILRKDQSGPSLTSWEENDIAGRFIIEPILSGIDASDVLVADITVLNFNVVFEIGYGIGRRKRVLLTKSGAVAGSDELIRQIGIFDTLGYSTYNSSAELAGLLRRVGDADPLTISDEINRGAPVFLILPRVKSDVEIQIISRIKKARLGYRTFDPEEQGRMAAGDAIENVAQSHGVVVPLLGSYRTDATVHNYRAAFVAGIALALGRELLILQQGEDPVPLDYRDLVSSYQSMDQIREHIAEFAIAVGARFQQGAPTVIAEPKSFLERLNLGASAAENELQDLGYYYLETDEYRRGLSGEVRVVTGRKGAGKTALFAQLRDRLRKDKSRVVLDLRPEGFQLLKFKERVLDYLEEGSKDHTITAFWEYLLLLETCNKLLEKDRQVHMRNDRLFQPYRDLSEAYFVDPELAEGDFSERMVKLTERIADDFQRRYPAGEEAKALSRGEITELLYRHDLATLRDRVVAYLDFKDGLWILFDNLDKGWPPHGVSEADVLTLRSLIDAMGKLERELSRRDVECHGIVFVRNDVYELLVSNTADRGKVASISLDWTDPALLRELLRRRFVYTDDIRGNPTFEDLWHEIAVTHLGGEESSEYLIERSLMRPRALIELLRFCRAHAVNLGHGKIDSTDIEQGEEHYSNQILTNIGYEIGDVFPRGADVIWEFFGANEVISGAEIRDLVLQVAEVTEWLPMLELLLWYGFLGVIRHNEDTAYIYSVSYEMKRLKALVKKGGPEGTNYRVNPAFWRALEIQRCPS